MNNFSNHMHQEMTFVMKTKFHLPFYIPLIAETAQKNSKLSPLQAQTGPAIRQRRKTIAAHQGFKNNDNQLMIYKI
jgi:hypothetical protein